MNLPQRIVLAAGAMLIAIMALFPPWIVVFQGRIHAERFAGYSPIWQANTPTDTNALARIFGLDVQLTNPLLFSIRLDSARLAVQIGAVFLVTILLCALLKSKRVA